MSLLLDALKRAEQEKLARRGQETPSTEIDEIVPDKSAAAPRRKLELESDGMAPPGASVAESAAATAARPDREGAKAMFAAKQAFPSLPAATPTGRNKTILAVIVGGLAVAAAGGAYVWYEINATPGRVARAPLPVSAPKPVTPAAGVAGLPSASGTVAPASGVASPATIGAAATLAETPADRGTPVVPPVAAPKPGSARSRHPRARSRRPASPRGWP